MDKEFQQLEWSPVLAEDWQALLDLAVQEDLGREHDWTTVSLLGSEATAAAQVVSRESGVVAGLPAAEMVLRQFSRELAWEPHLADGDRLSPGQAIATVAGPARALLSAERILLNVIGRLSGIASRAAVFVQAIAGTSARIYDTRKTTPGWRLLEKYAVRAGGACNHRSGLYEAILIKDNHLAIAAHQPGAERLSPGDAVRRAKQFLTATLPDRCQRMIVEVEVDTLEQLRQVLPAAPDLVLLDNMAPAMLREAVALRNEQAPSIELEASGGISLETVRAVAEAGVDRISVGGLTHAATWLDIGLDWSAEDPA